MATAYVRLAPLPPWVPRALEVRRLSEGAAVTGVHGWFEDECLGQLQRSFAAGPRGEPRVLRCHLFRSHCEAEHYLLVELADVTAARAFASWVQANISLLLFDGPAALGGPISAFADEYIAPVVVEVLYRLPGNPKPPERYKSCGCPVDDPAAGGVGGARAAAAAASDGADGDACGPSGASDGGAAWAVAEAGASGGNGADGSPHGGSRDGQQRHRGSPHTHHHASPPSPGGRRKGDRNSLGRDHRRSSVGGSSAEKDRERGRGGDRGGTHRHHHHQQRKGPPGGSFSQPWGWPSLLQQHHQQHEQPPSRPTSPRVDLPQDVQLKVNRAKSVADQHEPQWMYYDAIIGGQSDLRTTHELLTDLERGRLSLDANVTNEDRGCTLPFRQLLESHSASAVGAHYNDPWGRRQQQQQQGHGGPGAGGPEFSFWHQ